MTSLPEPTIPVNREVLVHGLEAALRALRSERQRMNALAMRLDSSILSLQGDYQKVSLSLSHLDRAIRENEELLIELADPDPLCWGGAEAIEGMVRP